jgi:CheY-like chemotaxis protein
METMRRKILVVDDNLEFVDLIRRVLESRDFQVSVASDGRTAIEKALADVPDLIQRYR